MIPTWTTEEKDKKSQKIGGSKRGENEFSGKKRKRNSLTFPNTKLHEKKNRTSRELKCPTARKILDFEFSHRYHY
jgi:hypothetical protein